MAEGELTISNNRAAFHEYFVLDRVEAGLALLGTEVKSIREGKVNIKDGFIRIEGGQAFLENVHIQPWEAGNRQNHEPTRSRRLLMHKREIIELYSKVREQGLTIVPLRLYFKGGKAKVEIAVVRGKKQYDKRETEKRREADREAAVAMKTSRR